MEEKWTREQLRLEIGQHFMVGLDSTELTPEMERFLAEYQIGNVILFKHNVESGAQLRRLCADVQKCVRKHTGHGALIAIDQEGGPVTRLSGDSVNVPGAMAVAAAGGPELARRAGQLTGRQLRSLGVNFDFAPDMDVNCNPDNPVIGVRSYGDTPEQVIAYGAEMLRGLQESRVLACAKHFPGYGDLDLDPHLSLPRVTKPLEQLEKVELLPFMRAVEAGVASIMTAHVIFPALEPEEIPATMSRRIITGMLRERMGYEGLVVTDCMEMGAIASDYGTVQGAVRALQAGADIALVSHTALTAMEAVEAAEEALRNGSISMEELQRSTERILRFKRAYQVGEAEPEYDNAGDMQETDRILRRSIAGYRLPEGRIPDLGPNPLFASVQSYRATLVNNEECRALSFAGYMAEGYGGDSYLLSREPSKKEVAELFAAAEGHSALVIGTYNGHLWKEQREMLGRLDQVKVPVLVAAFGLPYDLQDAPGNVPGLAAWEYTPRSMAAVLAILRGEERPMGRMPIYLA